MMIGSEKICNNYFEEYQQSMEKKKEHINLVVIGDLESGKSTLSGQLIYKLGKEKQKIQQIIKTAETSGKAAKKYAWIMDTLSVERDRGITYDISRRQFQTPKYLFTLIDAPGHKDFMKNMVTGTSQADCAVLVVSANLQQFQKGFSEAGQTKQHALLAYILGVKQMIVAINKIDSADVNKERYQMITTEISKYLSQVGFNLQNVSFVPISAFQDINIIQKSEKLEWYQGPTLVEVLDKIEPVKKPIDKPLRIPIQDVYYIEGIGKIPVGRIEAGTIKPKTIVSFSPGGFSSEVKSIEMNKKPIDEGLPGDFVGLALANYEQGSIERGSVAGDLNNDPPRQVQSFLAQVIIINHPNPLKVGYTPIIDCHTSHIACRFDQFLSKIDRKTGKILEQNPKQLRNGDCAMIVLRPTKPMTCEPYTECPPLGRFSVRDIKRTVAVGVIKKCEKKNKNAPLPQPIWF